MSMTDSTGASETDDTTRPEMDDTPRSKTKDTLKDGGYTQIRDKGYNTSRDRGTPHCCLREDVFPGVLSVVPQIPDREDPADLKVHRVLAPRGEQLRVKLRRLR
jgi:hypothetical protein